MIRLTALAFAAAVILPTATLAADVYVNYSISSKNAEVKGRYTVNGYSAAQIKRFMAKDCRGKVGDIALVGKPRKKRGVLSQKFKTTCTGGLSSRHKGSRASFSVSKQPNGKNVAFVLGSDGLGNIVKFKENR